MLWSSRKAKWLPFVAWKIENVLNELVILAKGNSRKSVKNAN